MNLTVWRLVDCQTAGTSVAAKGPWNRSEAGLIHAYETPELAAFSMAMGANGLLPALFMRERLDLPLHHRESEYYVPTDWQMEAASKSSPRQWPIVDLAAHMRRENIFSLWIPSIYGQQQHSVLINTDHWMFLSVRMSTMEQVGTVKKLKIPKRAEFSFPV